MNVAVMCTWYARGVHVTTRPAHGVRSRVKHAAETVDSLSVRAGRHLRRSGGTRSLVIIYVLALHTLAFIILAIRAMLHAP